jgi:ribose 5-phosphate isomerase B
VQIIIANDHAGFILKEQIKEYLLEKKYSIIDVGVHSNEPVDYPDIVVNAINELKNQLENRMILICGSGVGMCIAANRHNFIRAAIGFNSEITKIARCHNDINTLILGSRFITVNAAKECINIFLTTSFEGGRHLQRINKIS